MPEPDRELLMEIIGEAMHRPRAERVAYVRAACADEQSRSEAVALLEALERAGPFLDAPTLARPSGTGLSEAPGSMVGRYRLVEQIGEGGFGVVFAAEQSEPVQRTVALKIIKLGMDTRAVVARFEAERQALAIMDHPCIAKVLDGGATEAGRPYFVMELVRGTPITRYCRDHGLSTRARLDLFVDVCRGVQHAHTKGVIHRDLKPANILVTEVDGRPVPRIIDFGIAKATDPLAAGKSAFTEARQLVGTPEYMSPEQALGPGADLDTRTDVYSLGVLLYELLTGATPLDGAELRSAAWDQMLRMIREVEPPKPSTRILTGGTGEPATPARSSALKGDLDWIVMCCLEKDRARRYQTADGLAADISRHLSGEAVLAAPPSRAYRVRKFVRRHRAAVGAASLVVTALAVGLGVALWQAGVASRERDRAEERRREAEVVAKFQASQLGGLDPELVAARFRENLLDEADAAESRIYPGHEGAHRAELERALGGVDLGNAIKRALFRNYFQRTVETIDSEFAGQPRIQADLLNSTAMAMRSLGLRTEYPPILRRALDLYRRELGEGDAKTLSCLSELGLAQFVADKKPAEAEATLRRAFDGLRRSQGENAPATVSALLNLSYFLQEVGRRSPEAATLTRDALARLDRADNTELRLRALGQLSVTLARDRAPEEAEQDEREALRIARRAYGDDDRRTIGILGQLAKTLVQRGDLTGATQILRQRLAASRRVLGDGHSSVGACLRELSALLAQQGQSAEAEALDREATDRDRVRLGADHPGVLIRGVDLGSLLRGTDLVADAIPALEAGLNAATLGGERMLAVRAVLLHYLARELRLSGNLDRAKDRALEAVALFRAHPAWSESDAQHANQVLAEVLWSRGEKEELSGLCRELVADARQAAPDDPARIARALVMQGSWLVREGKFSEAETVLRECVDIRAHTNPEGSAARWRYFYSMSVLGAALTGRAADAQAPARSAILAEAERVVLDAYSAIKDDPHVPRAPENMPEMDCKREVLQRVIDLYDAWNAFEPGAGYDQKAAQWRARLAQPAAISGAVPGR